VEDEDEKEERSAESLERVRKVAFLVFFFLLGRFLLSCLSICVGLFLVLTFVVASPACLPACLPASCKTLSQAAEAMDMGAVGVLKAEGNEFFRKGSYKEANAAYLKAIRMLDQGK
jgi:hypothetical protein